MVPPGHPLSSAADALAARFPALLTPAATPLGERFSRGDIVGPDGTPWHADEPVHPGDQLFFHRELAPEHVPEVDLPILLHDAHLLVIDKPHGIATMPRGVHVLGSALARLRRSTGIETLSPIHRLDRATAGVLAFSVRPEERARYQQMFARPASSSLQKTYRAVVPDPGWAVGEEQLLEDRLEKPRESLRTLVVPGEVNARTRARVLSRGEGLAVVELQPATGRTHQLRIQLASRGWPILGDELYGGKEALPLQLLAAQLTFRDPVTGDSRTLVSTRRLVL